MARPGGSRSGPSRDPHATATTKYPWSFRLRISDDYMDWIRKTAVEMRMPQQEIGRWALRLLREELDRVQGEGGIASRLVQASVEVSRVKVEEPKAPTRGARPERIKTKAEKDPSKRDMRSPEDRALAKLRSVTKEIEDARA